MNIVVCRLRPKTHAPTLALPRKQGRERLRAAAVEWLEDLALPRKRGRKRLPPLRSGGGLGWGRERNDSAPFLGAGWVDGRSPPTKQAPR
jgi:hypothetical protein